MNDGSGCDGEGMQRLSQALRENQTDMAPPDRGPNDNGRFTKSAPTITRQQERQIILSHFSNPVKEFYKRFATSFLEEPLQCSGIQKMQCSGAVNWLSRGTEFLSIGISLCTLFQYAKYRSKVINSEGLGSQMLRLCNI